MTKPQILFSNKQSSFKQSHTNDHCRATSSPNLGFGRNEWCGHRSRDSGSNTRRRKLHRRRSWFPLLEVTSSFLGEKVAQKSEDKMVQNNALPEQTHLQFKMNKHHKTRSEFYLTRTSLKISVTLTGSTG